MKFLDPRNVYQGSLTLGQSGPLVQGAVSTADPSYSDGETRPLSLTTAGLLRVALDASGITIGTVNQGSPNTLANGWPVKITDGTDLALVSSSGALMVDGTGGTFPISGTVTVNQGTSPWVVSGTVAATQSGTWTTGRTWTLSSGTDSVAVTGSVTVSGTVAATQSGTWNINNISGTVSLPTGAATEASLVKLTLTQGSLTSGQSGPLSQGAVTTAAPSYTTAQTSPLSLTTSGLLRVDASGTSISGTVTANQGTSPWVVGQSTAASLNATVVGTGTFAVQAAQSGTWNITNISGTISLPTGAATETTLAKLPLAQGSTTSGQSGPLVQGAVTTAAPSYTTAQTSPLSLTTSGALRVDGTGSTQPISGTVTANQGTSPWVVNQTQWNGVAVSVNNGTADTGTLRVAIASNNTAFSVNAVQSGTWNIATVTAVTAITNALPAGTNILGYNLSAATSSSTNTPTRISSSALEASHVIKASAGNLYTITGYNSKTSSQFIQVFNSTTVPADTTVPIYTFTVPPSSNFSLDFGTLGEAFSTGIAISNSSTAATKTIGSADCFFTVRFS